MALTSASTFANVETEYKDTASYEINESASEARRHAVAIRFFLILLPSSSVKGSNSVGYSADMLRSELHAAIEYARQADGGLTRKSNIVRFDGRSMRTNG